MKSVMVQGLDDPGLQQVEFPAFISPSYTLNRAGHNIAIDADEFKEMLQQALDLSPIRECLIEWYEYKR